MSKWGSNVSIRTLGMIINILDYWQRKDIWTLAKRGFHLATNHREIFLILKSLILFSQLSHVDFLVFILLFLTEWDNGPQTANACGLLISSVSLHLLLSSLLRLNYQQCHDSSLMTPLDSRRRSPENSVWLQSYTYGLCKTWMCEISKPLVAIFLSWLVWGPSGCPLLPPAPLLWNPLPFPGSLNMFPVHTGRGRYGGVSYFIYNNWEIWAYS